MYMIADGDTGMNLSKKMLRQDEVNNKDNNKRKNRLGNNIL